MQVLRGELVYEYRGKITTLTIKEISPSGIRLEVNGAGELKGKLNADSIDTTNVLLKPDRTFEFETKAIKITKEGEMVVALGGGKGRPTGPRTSSWEGEALYTTQSTRLSWLNNTTLLGEGTIDMASNEEKIRTYAKK